MKIPKKMSEENIIDQINIVINRIAPKYTFKGYEVDDIKQESFIICMDALKRYDETRPLENFLSVHLSNRLKNFVRDNYFTKDDIEKRKILAPKQLSGEDNVPSQSESLDNIIDFKQISKFIDKFLPVELRSDYLKMVHDAYLPRRKKNYLTEIIKSLLMENGYEEG